MSFDHMPACIVPPSDLRCEAIVKHAGWQSWSKERHRCVKKAVQVRGFISVCVIHAKVKEIDPWDGSPDKFEHRKIRNKDDRN